MGSDHGTTALSRTTAFSICAGRTRLCRIAWWFSKHFGGLFQTFLSKQALEGTFQVCCLFNQHLDLGIVATVAAATLPARYKVPLEIRAAELTGLRDATTGFHLARGAPWHFAQMLTTGNGALR